MAWTTIRLEVTTPLFNGGADGDGGIRVPSLRGALRFWFRTLAGVGVGADIDGLAVVERRVFGGTEASSPVKLRIAEQSKVEPPGVAKWCDRWISYLLGPGLTKPQKNLTKGGYDYPLLKPYVAPGATVDLQLRWSQDYDQEAALVLASLWMLCAYGGLGARTRRGCGGLRIVSVKGRLPDPWSDGSLRAPDLDHYESLTRLWPDGPIGKCVSLVRNVAANPRTKDDPVVLFDHTQAWKSDDDSPAVPPTYPALSKQYTSIGLSKKAFTSWPQALAHAGEQLRFFRASEDYPGAPYRPGIKTPEWEETVTTPAGVNLSFGLGALGLPVTYKKPWSVNADRGGTEELRRASPLWLRPVSNHGEWRLLSFAFQSEFLPPDISIHVWRHEPGGRQLGKTVHVTHQDIIERTSDWIETMRAGETFVR